MHLGQIAYLETDKTTYFHVWLYYHDELTFAKTTDGKECFAQATLSNT